jgi:threonine dehydrogenase-like Zn-dependent dehydrogenase
LKALVVKPGVRNSAQLVEHASTNPGDGALLVRGRAVGICGTDVEIIEGGMAKRRQARTTWSWDTNHSAR